MAYEGERMTNKVKAFETIVNEMVELYKRKNSDYGDSFGKAYKELGVISAVTRLNDKMNRLKSLTMPNAVQKVNDESIADTLIDIANYAVMTLIELKGENTMNETTKRSTGENTKQAKVFGPFVEADKLEVFKLGLEDFVKLTPSGKDILLEVSGLYYNNMEIPDEILKMVKRSVYFDLYHDTLTDEEVIEYMASMRILADELEKLM